MHKREFEKISGIHESSRKLPQAHEKVCDENERNKEKNDNPSKRICGEGGLYKAVAEDWHDRFR